MLTITSKENGSVLRMPDAAGVEYFFSLGASPREFDVAEEVEVTTEVPAEPVAILPEAPVEAPAEAVTNG